jgi:hypothetical protein
MSRMLKTLKVSSVNTDRVWQESLGVMSRMSIAKTFRV